MLFVIFILVERRVRDPLIRVVRLVSMLSLVGGAVLLAITLIGRRTRQASEIASPAS